MYLTQDARVAVWKEWMRIGPEHVIARYAPRAIGLNSDQNFVEDVLGASSVRRWQDNPLTPVASYKVHIRNNPNRRVRDN
jgi:hypothetical protein